MSGDENEEEPSPPKFVICIHHCLEPWTNVYFYTKKDKNSIMPLCLKKCDEATFHLP